MTTTAYKTGRIVHQTAPADAVYTLNITAGFVKAGFSFMKIGPAFMRAHESLEIYVKWDKASNHGWVTPEESEQIKAHMTATLTAD